MNSRDEILALLHGHRLTRLPVFGVLPSLTAAGIKKTGARYGELHADAGKMADAAATTFEIYGWESAVVPFDLCVEAEALGCQVDFQNDVDAFLAPTITVNLPQVSDPAGGYPDAAHAGRVPLVADAIRLLKQRVGDKVAIGAWIPGPFTLAWQMFGVDAWLSAVAERDVAPTLQRLAEWLPGIAKYYRDAGADFITVHDMGGSPQIIGAAKFRSVVKLALQSLFTRLPKPNILSVCGDTNAVVRDLAECGANAINIDHRNDLARTRQTLGADAVILGNLDPVGVLSHGTVEDVRRVVEKIAQAGANAVVPGCDLYPDVPDENMRALVASSRRQVVK